MSLDYVVLSYRVMWRRNEYETWSFEDFSSEETAFSFFKTLHSGLSELFECKLLKINALESWY